MLNNIVDNLEQCGQQTLFNAVFIRPEQVVWFFCVKGANASTNFSKLLNLLNI